MSPAERHHEADDGFALWAPLRWLERPATGRLVLCLGLLLSASSLGVGFLADDHWFVAQLEARLPDQRAWWDLYRFTATSDEGNRAAVEAGMLPWWTALDLRIRFLRPLSSALLALDFRLFGAHPLGWHAQEIAWWMAFLLAARALYTRLLPVGTANLALLLVAFSPASAQAYGWIAARHLVIAGVFSMLAVLAHIRAREDGSRAHRWLAPALLGLGLIASEAGLSGAAFWVAYEATGPPRLGSIRARLTGATPAVVLAAGYVAIYATGGFGVSGSSIYVSPLRDPGRFAVAAAQHLPTYMGQALLGVPSESSLQVGGPGAHVALGLGAVVLFVLLATSSWSSTPAPERNALRWLAIGALLSGLAIAGAIPAGRSLLVLLPGAAPVVAVVLARAGDPANPWRPVRQVVAGILLAEHVLLAPISAGLVSMAGSGISAETDRVAAALGSDLGADAQAFVLTPNPIVAVYAPTQALSDRPWPCWSWVSGTVSAHRLTFDADSIAVETLGTSFTAGSWPSLYRTGAEAMRPGAEILQCGARIRVEAVAGGQPTRIRLTMPPASELSLWDGTRVVRLGPALGRSEIVFVPN